MKFTTRSHVSILVLLLIPNLTPGQSFNLSAAPGNSQSLELIGAPAPGSSLEVRVTANPGDVVSVFAGTIAQTTNLGSGLTLEIDPQTVFGVTTLVADGTGKASILGTWPMGIQEGTFLIMQACVGSASGLQLTNASTLIAQDVAPQQTLGAPTVADVVSPTTASSIQVTGTASNPGATILIQNGMNIATVTADQGAAMTGFSASVALTQNAPNQIFVYEVDGNGAQSPPAVLEVVQDQQPPNISITFPPAGSTLSTPSTIVTGTVGDLLSGFMGLDVTVEGVPANVHVGVGTNGTFDIPNVPLVTGGPTILQATATDAAGNSQTVSITVQFEAPVGIHLEAISGDFQSGPVNQVLVDPIVVQVVDDNANPVADRLLTFEVIQSNGRLSADGTSPGTLIFQTVTDAAGTAQAMWKMGSDAGMGNNRVKVTGTGVDGIVYFCASAQTGPATQINIGSGNNQMGEVGAPLCEAFSAWVNDSGNGIAGVPVVFTVTQGGGLFPSGGSTVTVSTDVTGHAEASLVLGASEGTNVVEATFAGNPGAPAVFVASGIVRDLTLPTRLEGIVLSNGREPIGGATCQLILPGAPSQTLTTTSSVDGRFAFDNIPVSGAANLLVNGLTATQVGGNTTPVGSFPSLSFEPVLVPNAVNTLSRPVLLPMLDPQNAVLYDGTEDIELTVAGIDGLKMIIKAGSMILPDGSIPNAANPTVVSLNQVQTDDIPMPVGDGAAPPFAWTLQPSGSHFNPPVKVIYPNMSGLPAGAVTYFLSFNHTTRRFEIVAQGHVLPDGTCSETDEGQGLSVAGWGCQCPPYPPTGDCCDCAPKPNGCGAEDGIKFPNSIPFVFDFTQACNNHDICYGTLGSVRSNCDDTFLSEMLASCSTLNLPCQALAYSYYLGVHFFGGGPFNSAQQAAMDCLNQCNAGSAPITALGMEGTGTILPPPPGWVDADMDMIPDSWESAHGLDPTDPNDNFQDPDGDGLSNFLEYAGMLDPMDPDTDDDGENDLVEYELLTFNPGLDDDFVATAGGQSAAVSVIGTYRIPNIAINGEIQRVSFAGTDNGRTVYGRSEFFPLSANSTYVVSSVEVSDTPFPSPVALSIVSGTSVLAMPGDSTQITTTAILTDGSSEVRDGLAAGSTYTSSNTEIATVDQNGLVTGVGQGTVFLTVRNEGVTGVISLIVGAANTSIVQGQVVDAQQNPVAGATVAVGPLNLVTGTQGLFSGTLPVLSPSVVGQAQATINGSSTFGQSPSIQVIVGGITDLGTIVVDIDSDGDGLPDWYELNVFGTDPNLVDSDGDGLSDGFEAFVLGTDPGSQDSDLDGFSDGFEHAIGSDPGSFDPATNVVGTILLPDGNPAVGATARILGAPAGLFQVSTGADGSFAMPPWPSSISPVNVSGQLGGLFGASGPKATVPGGTTNVGTIDLTSPGTLFPNALYSFGGLPAEMAAIDLDGNGVTDLVAANSAGTAVHVLVGLGDGAFVPGNAVDMGHATVRIATGDLDGDGIEDIVARSTQGDLLVSMGTISGVFDPPQSFGLIGQPVGLSLAELTGDGVLDALLVDQGAIRLVPGDGSGGFDIASISVVGATGASVDVASVDFDGDGDTDLLVAADSPPAVLRLENDGAGVFTLVQTLPLAGAPASVAAGDVNGDGFADMAASIPNSGSVATALGDANGALGSPILISTGGAPDQVVIADVNGDARGDVLLTRGVPPTVVILLSGTSGPSQVDQTLGTGFVPAGIIVDDLNSDGLADVAALSTSSMAATVFLGNGAGSFPQPISIPVTAGPVSALVSGDLDGDGHADLVGVQGDSIVTVMGNGTASFAPPQVLPVGGSLNRIRLSDMDQDGALDVVGVVQGSSVNILLGDGTGGAFVSIGSFSAGGVVKGLRVADLNGDQLPDVIVGRGASGLVSILPSVGAGFLGTPIPISTGQSADGLALTDVDGDGDLDILVISDASQALVTLTNQGQGAFSVSAPLPLGLAPSAIEVGDLDGDGDEDVVVASATDGAISTLINSQGVFQPMATALLSPAPQEIGLRDMNGDGVEDVVVTQFTSNSIAVLLGLGGGQLAQANPFATQGVIPRGLILQDFNEDGFLDVGTSVLNPNSISILLNQTLLVP